MPHRNAILIPAGRLRRARCVVEGGWPLRRRQNGFRCRCCGRIGGRALLGTGDQRRARISSEPPSRHYEMGVDIDPRHRLTAIFTELAHAI